MRKLDAFMTKLVVEHQMGWRRGLGVTYAVLIAWNLWDVVRRDTWWGVNLFSAAMCAGFWAVLAWTWRRQDGCDEIQRHVTEAIGDPDLRHAVWLWAYGRKAWERREIITWMRTHELSAVHPDDMPPAVRDLAKFLVLLRS